MKKDERRQLKNFYINKNIQNRIITMNLIYMCIIAILIMGIMLTHSADSLLSKQADTGLRWQGVPLSVKLYSLVGLSFVFVILSQLWLTHKVCGAMINFTNTYQKIGQGDLTQKVMLRKVDLLHQEAGQFNSMMENLIGLVATVKKDQQQLMETLNEWGRDPNPSQKTEEIRTKLGQQQQQLSDSLSKLVLPDQKS